MKVYLKTILYCTVILFFTNNDNIISIDKKHYEGTPIQSLAVRSNPKNLHIKNILYDENTLYQYIGYYGVATIINFDKNEEIVNLIMGDTTAWQFHNLGNKLLLKPIGESDVAETNAIIYTNKNRTYHIMMKAEEPSSIYNKDIPFEIRFIYNTNESLDFKKISDINEKLHKVDIANLNYINFDYTVAGNDSILPIRVFDDARFTYFQFYDINGNIPAIFAVNSDGYESLINFKIQDNYVVVDRVVPRFTLRHGDIHACVYNEDTPFTFIREKQ